MLFRTNKPGQAPEELSPAGEEAAPGAIVDESPGAAILAQMLELATTSPLAADEIVRRSIELHQALQTYYREYVEDGVARGLDKAQIQSALVSGWNNGSVPRAVPGDVERGCSNIIILNGLVPEDVFGYFDDRDGYGVVLPGTKDYFGSIQERGSVILEVPRHDLPFEPDPDNPDGFYVDWYRMPGYAPHVEDVERASLMVARVVALMDSRPNT